MFFRIITILSLVVYYFCVFIFSAQSVSQIVQNELVEKMFIIFANYRSLVILIFLPCVSLLPDLSIKFFKIFLKPSPIDILLRGGKEVFHLDSTQIYKKVDDSNQPSNS
jgi:hypothetical protein